MNSCEPRLIVLYVLVPGSDEKDKARKTASEVYELPLSATESSGTTVYKSVASDPDELDATEGSS